MITGLWISNFLLLIAVYTLYMDNKELRKKCDKFAKIIGNMFEEKINKN